MSRLSMRGRRFSIPPGSALAILVAALSGTKYVWDGTTGVANAGGVATGVWSDVQGPGHGPDLVMGKGAGAYPAYDAVDGGVTTDGSQNYFESALDSGLALGHNSCTVMIVEHTGAGQSLFISDGTNSKYYSLGIDAGGFKIVTAGMTAGSDPAANAAVVNGATRRLLMAARTNDYELAPHTDPIQPDANIYTEYCYADVYPYPRSWTYVRQQFAAGSMKMTGGRNPGGSGYVAAKYFTIIHLDHRPTYAEQQAIRTYALTRSIAHPAQKKLMLSDGNSVAAAFNAGSVNYATRLLSAAPAGYTAKASRAATWDVINVALTPSGRQGQWISDPHAGGTSTHTIFRQSDLVQASVSAENTDAMLIFDEIVNDITINTGLTDQQRADIAVASIQSAVTVALGHGITKIVVKTALKTVTGSSGITPWDITGSAGARGGRETQRALVNDYLRANWRTMGIWKLWDPAGNYRMKQPTLAPYYDGVDFSHPLSAGQDELTWGIGDPANGNGSEQSAYNASYNAAYLAQTGVDLHIDGPFYVGLDSTLFSGGV